MNPYQNQTNNPYASLPTGGNATFTEAWALIAAARQITESLQIDDAKVAKAAMQAALRVNWKLWTIFQAELAVDEEASVHDDLRLNMLTLAKFVDNHTVQQLPNPEPERLLVLVDINRNIANGLLEGANAEQEALEVQQAEATASDAETDGSPETPPPGLPSGFEQEA